ncbi:MAG: type I-B CRISPR-associated endonuclease Cas1b [Candidatus Brocadiaceae bacterium]|nr:type I-B CRISPR-associated endonuclease Cas1b [Candidatus Brocadiaceae bacterium]
MKQNYYIFNNGRLKRKENTIFFVKEDDTRVVIPIENTEALYAFGEIDLNTKLLNYLAQKSIPVHVFNYYGFYSGSYYPREYLNSGQLLVKQVNHYNSRKKRLLLARTFIEAASFNIQKNLRYYKNRGKPLDEYIDTIEGYRSQIDKANSVDVLMGIEGNIRNAYYKAWPVIIDQKIEFERRVKQPPDNMINALISYVNSVVYTTCLGEIYHTQLSPLISFLHEPGDRRYSLSLDLAEVFKPILSDRIIFTLLNRQQITEKDCMKEINFCYLSENGRKTVIREYDERLKTVITHKKLERQVSYRYLIRLECYKLVKHLIGEQVYEGFKIWW